MATMWDLRFDNPSATSVYARHHRWIRESLPDLVHLTTMLEIPPQGSEFNLRPELSAEAESVNTPWMSYTDMISHLVTHVHEQTKYTVGIRHKGVDANASPPASGAMSPERIVRTEISRSLSPAKRDKVDDDKKDVMDKGKRPDTSNFFPRKIASEQQPGAESSVLRMKGRQELGTPPNYTATNDRPRLGIHTHSNDSDDDSEADERVWTSQEVETTDLNPVDPTSLRAGDLLVPTAGPSNPCNVEARKPLFDPSQLQQLERIVVEAARTVPAGSEKNDLHQRILSMLENLGLQTPSAKEDKQKLGAPSMLPPAGAMSESRSEVGDRAISSASTLDEPMVTIPILESVSRDIEHMIPATAGSASRSGQTPFLQFPHTDTILNPASEQVSEMPIPTPGPGYSHSLCRHSTGLCRDNDSVMILYARTVNSVGALITISKPSGVSGGDLMFKLIEVDEKSIREKIEEAWGAEWSKAPLEGFNKLRGVCTCPYEPLSLAECLSRYQKMGRGELHVTSDLHLRFIKSSPHAGTSSKPTGRGIFGSTGIAPEPVFVNPPPVAIPIKSPGYGLKPEDLLESACTTPTSDSPPLAPICHPTGSSAPDILAPATKEGILSPKSQDSLKNRYLADLIASPLNTPLSNQVYTIIQEENVGLDSSLGLKLLDLARSLRTNGDLVQEGKEKEAPVSVQKVDKMEMMLKKVLDKLNDHSGMLNAIAEASGVNLLDDEEAAGGTVTPPPNSADIGVSAAPALPSIPTPPGFVPLVKASVQVNSPSKAATTEDPPSPSPVVAVLVEEPSTLPNPTSTPVGLPIVPEAVVPDGTAGAAAVIADLVSSIFHSPLFTPASPSAEPNTQARPMPTVEDYQSESESSHPSERSVTPTANKPIPSSPPQSANPFADPPRFGQSYTPTRSSGYYSAPRSSRGPTIVAPSEGAFARYAASQQAFPSASAHARNASNEGRTSASPSSDATVFRDLQSQVLAMNAEAEAQRAEQHQFLVQQHAQQQAQAEAARHDQERAPAMTGRGDNPSLPPPPWSDRNHLSSPQQYPQRPWSYLYGSPNQFANPPPQSFLYAGPPPEHYAQTSYSSQGLFSANANVQTPSGPTNYSGGLFGQPASGQPAGYPYRSPFSFGPGSRQMEHRPDRTTYSPSFSFLGGGQR